MQRFPEPVEVVASLKKGDEIYYSHFLGFISLKFVAFPVGSFNEVCFSRGTLLRRQMTDYQVRLKIDLVSYPARAEGFG